MVKFIGAACRDPKVTLELDLSELIVLRRALDATPYIKSTVPHECKFFTRMGKGFDAHVMEHTRIVDVPALSAELREAISQAGGI